MTLDIGAVGQDKPILPSDLGKSHRVPGSGGPVTLESALLRDSSLLKSRVMQSLLAKIIAWLAEKAVTVVAVVVLGVAVSALWIFIREQQLRERDRTVRQQQIVAELSRQDALRAAAEAQIERLATQIAEESQRVERAARLVRTLGDLDTWWQRWFGDVEQARRNRERAESLRRLQDEAAARLRELDLGRAEAGERLSGVLASETELRRELRALEIAQPEWVRYVVRGWERAQIGLMIAVAAYLFGPSLWKLWAYFLMAPLLARAPGVRVGSTEAAGLRPETKGVSVDLSLWPGERLEVRQRFLQASDEGLKRRTRLLLDWRHPLTSLASGLVELTALRNQRAGTVARVTLADSRAAQQELCVLEVAAGSSLVLRPRALVAVITSGEQRLRLRARWLLSHWLSWAMLHFRVFELQGPCRLVITGTRGVRVETLGGSDRPPARRRINRGAAIGFSSGLEHRVVRAETFWAYYRGHHPLLDDLFSGNGTLLCEQAGCGEADPSGRRWSAAWNGFLRAIGL